MRKGI